MTYSSFYARFYTQLIKIKEAFLVIFAYRSGLVYIVLIISWQLILWLEAFLIRRILSGEIVVLHYNIDFGIDLVAPAGNIYFYPCLALLVVFFNFILLMILSRRKDVNVLINYLLGSAWVFHVFLSLVLLSVYLINFR
jgi:hypothetical protein